MRTQFCSLLGSVGTAVRGVGELRRQWEALAGRTDRPVAINHTGRPFDEEVFDAILDAAPAAISFHMGVPREQIARAHDVGAKWIQQVGDLRTAELALEAGADVLVAPGSEAGGNSGWVATIVLVPQVVDAAGLSLTAGAPAWRASGGWRHMGAVRCG